MRAAHLIASIAALSLALASCEPRTANEAARDLRSADADDRIEAAHDLSENGYSRAELPVLLSALASERDPGAKSAMLVALGDSGAPEAPPWIDAFRADPDPSVRAAAATAGEHWLVASGAVWPEVYGTESGASSGPPVQVFFEWQQPFPPPVVYAPPPRPRPHVPGAVRPPPRPR